MSSLVLSDGTRSYDFLAEPVPDIYVQQDGLSLPVVTTENTYAEGSDSEGRTRIRSRATNSEAGSFAVFFKGATDALFWDAVDNFQELVLSAHRNKGTLTYTPPGGVSVTYDLEAINVTELPQRGVLLAQRHGEATVSFETKPYGRLATRRLNLTATYQERVAALTPAIFLPLGSSAGLTDLSGNGRNGTAAGGVTVGGVSGPLSVDDRGATDFDGTNDAITTSYAPFTNGTVRTFMGWTYSDALSGNRTLFGGSGGNVTLRRDSGTYDLSFYPNSASGGPTWTGVWPGEDQWVHWALVFNESTDAVSLYINGALKSSTTTAVAYPGSPGNFQIGSRAAEFFDGRFAWVSVHHAALTAAQIVDAYNSGRAWYKLNGPIDGFAVKAIPGQVPAWATLELQASSGPSRNHVEVGVQNDFDPNLPEPLLLQSVVHLDALSGASNTRSGSYSANIIRAALTTSPVAVCKAASQPHKGKWKVRVRVYPSAVTARVRLAWRAGDGPFAKEKWVSVPNSGGWFDLDLGIVNIKELPSGHTSEFRIEAKTTSGVPTVDVDYLEMIPADSYMKLRGSTVVDTPSASVIAVDDFSTQTAGAVSGKTPLLAPSGNWSGAGDSDDFQVDATNHQIYRSVGGDSAITNGRFLRIGSGTLAASTAQVDLSYDIATGGRQGVFLRYLDTNNWLLGFISAVQLSDNGAFLFASISKRVAGTETVLGAAYLGTVPRNGSASPNMTITLSADAAGNAILRTGRGAVLEPRVLVTGDSHIATAGTLATGGYGIYDAVTTGPDDTRYFDNFSVSTLATSASILNPAINATFAATLTHETALTSSATSTGTTPIREGKYLTLPPATRNGSASRVVVKARRDDVDNGLPDSGLSDSLTATLSVTPRVHLTGQ